MPPVLRKGRKYLVEDHSSREIQSAQSLHLHSFNQMWPPPKHLEVSSNLRTRVLKNGRNVPLFYINGVFIVFQGTSNSHLRETLNWL